MCSKVVLPLASLLVLTVTGCEAARSDRKPAGAAEESVPAVLAQHPANDRPLDHRPGTVTLGAPIRGSNTVALSQIAENATKYAKQTVKTQGRVTSVCQSMGCWMEITDSNGTAHVRMTGHSFFIPKDAAGRMAVLEGTVLAKPDEGECEQEAQQATGHLVKVEIDATGVVLL
jgi:hypothetical protein